MPFTPDEVKAQESPAVRNAMRRFNDSQKIQQLEQQLAQARKQAFLDAIAAMERVRGHEAIYFRVYAEAIRQEAEKQ